MFTLLWDHCTLGATRLCEKSNRRWGGQKETQKRRNERNGKTEKLSTLIREWEKERHFLK